MIIESLEIDEDGYPSESALTQIRALKNIDGVEGVRAVGRFMMEDFQRLAESLPYASVWVEDSQDCIERPLKLVCFSTGGWSGCEDFIEACLSVPLVRLIYYYSWHRGGHYAFELKEIK